ncbi:MAG TPA: phage holin family protein [Lactobacillaceae bacterium]|jgi:putative membrane protein
MSLILRLAVNMILFVFLSQVFSGGFHVQSWPTALLAAIVLAVLNALVKPILLILTLPITVVTLGLFMVVINALMLELTATLVHGFAFASFGWAMVIALLVSLANMAISSNITVERIR